MRSLPHGGGGHEHPDGSITLSPRAVKALRTLVYGDVEDKSPSIKVLDRVLGETGCDEFDRETILHVLGLKD